MQGCVTPGNSNVFSKPTTNARASAADRDMRLEYAILAVEPERHQPALDSTLQLFESA